MYVCMDVDVEYVRPIQLLFQPGVCVCLYAIRSAPTFNIYGCNRPYM